MKRSEEFKLIGHLQVMDVPLTSLYAESTSGKFFLFVRVDEDRDLDSFILSEVSPSVVLEYMNGVLGLRSIFETRPVFYYHKDSEMGLEYKKFKPLSQPQALSKLNAETLSDYYDRTLAYRSATMRNYLAQL